MKGKSWLRNVPYIHKFVKNVFLNVSQYAIKWLPPLNPFPLLWILECLSFSDDCGLYRLPTLTIIWSFLNAGWVGIRGDCKYGGCWPLPSYLGVGIIWSLLYHSITLHKAWKHERPNTGIWTQGLMLARCSTTWATLSTLLMLVIFEI
jgi:hypothetical protein